MRAAKKEQNERMQNVVEKCNYAIKTMEQTRSRYGDAIDPEHAEFLDSTMDGLHTLRKIAQSKGGAHGRGV